MTRSNGQQPERRRTALRLVDEARDRSTQMQVTSLTAEVDEKAGAFAADARLLDNLAEIRESIEELVPAQSEAAYAAAFRSASLGPEDRPPAKTARAIAARPAKVALAITVALDFWAGLRRDRANADGAKRLITIARLADPEPWRDRLRATLIELRGEARLAALRDLASSAQSGELPAVSLLLLGEALLKAGDAATAEAVLRIAQRRHPDDVWLSLLLGQALEKLRAVQRQFVII